MKNNEALQKSITTLSGTNTVVKVDWVSEEVSENQGRIQKFLKGGADGTKLRTFRRKLLEKRAKSNPKVGAAAPTAPPLDPPLP